MVFIYTYIWLIFMVHVGKYTHQPQTFMFTSSFSNNHGSGKWPFWKLNSFSLVLFSTSMIMGGRISLDLHVHTYKISRIICRCSIYSMNIYIYIYNYLHISIYLYIPKIQCNLLVGFNGIGFMPWAFGLFWRSCCPLQPNNPGCDTGVVAGVAGREASGYHING